MKFEANKILEEYKFKKIGSFHIDKNNFIVDYEEQFGEMDQCIYIHVIDNKIVRVGSSKNKLKSRMKSWERDVSKALNGEKSSTPLWEAELWRKKLNNKKGDLYFRQGWITKTPIGKFNSYLSEESYLIGKFQPEMNRSKHR